MPGTPKRTDGRKRDHRKRQAAVTERLIQEDEDRKHTKQENVEYYQSKSDWKFPRR